MMQIILTLPNTTVHFLSATIPQPYSRVFFEQIGLPLDSTVVLRSHTQQPSLSWQFYNMKVNAKLPEKGEASSDVLHEFNSKCLATALPILQALASLLVGDERGMVFVTTRLECNALAGMLRSKVITGDTSREERVKAYREWKQGVFKVLCLNKAGFQGTDYPHVRFAVVIGILPSLNDLVQCMGRAGRDGHPSLALVLLPFERPRTWKSDKPSNFAGEHQIQELTSRVVDSMCIRYAISAYQDGRRLAVECKGLVDCNKCMR